MAAKYCIKCYTLLTFVVRYVSGGRPHQQGSVRYQLWPPLLHWFQLRTYRLVVSTHSNLLGCKGYYCLVASNIGCDEMRAA